MRRVGAVGWGIGWTNREAAPLHVKVQHCMQTFLPNHRIEFLQRAVNNIALPPQKLLPTHHYEIAEAITLISSASPADQKNGMKVLDRLARCGYAYKIFENIDQIHPYLMKSNHLPVQKHYIALLALLAIKGHQECLHMIVAHFLTHKSQKIRRQIFYEFDSILMRATNYNHRNIIAQAVAKALQQRSIKIGMGELEVLEKLVQQGAARSRLVLEGAIAAIQGQECLYIGFKLSVHLSKRIPDIFPFTIHHHELKNEKTLQEYCAKLLPHLIQARHTYFGVKN